MNLKFRNRIAFYTTLAVALMTALVFVIIYTVVHHTAYNNAILVGCFEKI